MPSFSRSLEMALHKALSFANERDQEFATLEHLLLALADDKDAAAVMRACNVDLEKLQGRPERIYRHRARQPRQRRRRGRQADRRLPARHPARRHPRAVLGPRGGDRRERARRDLRRAREPRRVFPARAGHDPLRRGELHLARHRQAAGRGGDPPGARRARGGRPRRRRSRRDADGGKESALGRLVHQPERQGARRKDRSADRPRARAEAHHPGALPPLQEQPALCRRSRRRQDGDRRRPRQEDRRERRAGGAGRRHHLRARHGRAPRRHALSRRFRGAAEAGHQGARGARKRHHVHRRDPHGDRRRRDVRRRDGRLEPSEAGARLGQSPLHRLDHLQGIPAVLREGPRARPPLPEDRRERAVAPRHGRDPEGPEALLRGPPQGPLHERGDQVGGRALGALHQRPQAARQGDRRDRRVRRVAEAAAGGQAQEDDRHQGYRGDGRDDGAHPAEIGVEGRRRGAAAHRRQPEARRVRPGQGDRRARRRRSSSRAPACASRRSRSAATSSPARPASARPRWRSSSPS